MVINSETNKLQVREKISAPVQLVKIHQTRDRFDVSAVSKKEYYHRHTWSVRIIKDSVYYHSFYTFGKLLLSTYSSLFVVTTM